MPSSMCWPSGEKRHFCADGMRSSRKVSAISPVENSPRRFTQGPRLVETVTSGEVVTICAASGLSDFASASISRPNAICVETAASAGVLSGIEGSFAAGSGAAPAALNGTASRNACRSAAGRPSPSNGSHSWPARTPIRVWNSAICAGVISPAWLSLWPASGVP